VRRAISVNKRLAALGGMLLVPSLLAAMVGVAACAPQGRPEPVIEANPAPQGHEGHALTPSAQQTPVSALTPAQATPIVILSASQPPAAAPTATPSPTPAQATEPSPVPTRPIAPTATPTFVARKIALASTPTRTPVPTATPDPLGAQFFLNIASPEDAATVSSPSVEVAGQTRVDAVVSVNDDLVGVDESGRFKAVVVLEEGPNVIEVVASLADGQEESRVLTVFYVP
jgi:hypothetical protein